MIHYPSVLAGLHCLASLVLQLDIQRNLNVINAVVLGLAGLRRHAVILHGGAVADQCRGTC